MNKLTVILEGQLNIGCHPYSIVFNKLLYDAQAFGRSSISSECIQLNPTNTQAQNTVSLWHEILSVAKFNLTGEHLNELDACILSEAVCSVFKELGVEFDYSKIKAVVVPTLEGEPKEK